MDPDWKRFLARGSTTRIGLGRIDTGSPFDEKDQLEIAALLELRLLLLGRNFSSERTAAIEK
jgi:hypothetical protein